MCSSVPVKKDNGEIYPGFTMRTRQPIENSPYNSIQYMTRDRDGFINATLVVRSINKIINERNGVCSEINDDGSINANFSKVTIEEWSNRKGVKDFIVCREVSNGKKIGSYSDVIKFEKCIRGVYYDKLIILFLIIHIDDAYEEWMTNMMDVISADKVLAGTTREYDELLKEHELLEKQSKKYKNIYKVLTDDFIMSSIILKNISYKKNVNHTREQLM